MAAADDPIPIVAPAYILAGGALVGIIFTVAFQAIQAAAQRRFDQRSKAFDVRIELYAEILLNIEEMKRLREDVERVSERKPQKEFREALDELQQARERLKNIEGEIERSGSVAEMPESRKRELLESAKRATADHTAAEARMRTARSGLDNSDKSLELLRERLDASWRSLLSANGRLKIVSEERTIRAATALLERHAASEDPTAAEQAEYRTATRKELGLE